MGCGDRPGEPLNELALAKTLQMSRAPVREAINRLAGEGLVLLDPGRGFAARPLSIGQAVAAYEVRADLEVAAVTAIAAVVPQAELAELRSWWQQVKAAARTPASSSEPAGTRAGAEEVLIDADEEFHRRLAALAGNSERTRLLEQLNARIRFVRRMNLTRPGRASEALAEHDGILEALLSEEPLTAAGLMRDHLALSRHQAEEAVGRGLHAIYSPAATD